MKELDPVTGRRMYGQSGCPMVQVWHVPGMEVHHYSAVIRDILRILGALGQTYFWGPCLEHLGFMIQFQVVRALFGQITDSAQGHSSKFKMCVYM